METHKANNQAIIDFARAHVEPRLVELEGPDGRKAKVLVLPRGLSAHDAKPFLDKYLTAPERRTGIARVQDLASFIEHTKRFADDDSVIFANPSPDTPSLTTVFDYHRKTHAGAPRFGTHRSHYTFPLSDEWKAWKTKNAVPMSQKEFSELIEDRLADIGDPQEAGPMVVDLAQKLGGSFASPSRLRELAREFAVRENAVVKEARNLSTGETQIQYVSQHVDEAGAPLKIPNLFVVHIPIFLGGVPYEIAVRLRYRVRESRPVWFYELYRADKLLDLAFREACATAQKETGLPLFCGSPEA